MVKNAKKLRDVPKVTYDIASIELETNQLFHRFTKSGNDRWKESYNRAFPNLSSQIVATAKSEKEVLNLCRECVRKQHALHKSKIEDSKTELKLAWDKIGPEYLRALADYFETDWPAEPHTIVGYVWVQPIFPRWINRFEFCVPYGNRSRAIETAAHEILHFLWFKKWGEVFPEMKRDTYETPHLVWRLSEIIDPIILQCHQRIWELIRPQGWGYDSFKTISIGDVGLTDYFKNIYEDAVKSEKSFDNVMHTLWEEIKRHDEIIKF